MSQLNPLNDLSRVYLDQVANINGKKQSDDVKRWETGNQALDQQMETSSNQLATLGAPTMEEGKMADKDYDGDGKIESGKDEYFGSKDKAIKKAMGKKIKQEAMTTYKYDDKLYKAIKKDDKETPKITPKSTLVKKEETDNSYVEAYVAELKKTTLGSYVSKASQNLSDRRFDQGRSEKATYEPDADDDKEEMKLRQREKGISRAAKKLSKEEVVHEKVATGPRLGEPREKGATHMNAGEQEKISKRTKEWMGKKGMTGAPGGDAMKAREAEHQARRGVKKEETEVNEADSLAGQVSRWEAARQKRMKQRQSYERPHWIPKDQDHEDRYGSSKGVKVKKESLSNWRQDLIEISDAIPMTDTEFEKEVKEKKGINNKVVINPKMSEAVAQIGGELIAEKEVDVPDTRRTVDAIRAYDRSKDASRDATYDTMHGKKKKGDIEKKYAKKERGEIDKDDPNWKHRKYHTGIHGEETEFTEGYGKKKKHDCASKVKHEEFGVGNCIKGMHTIDENNMVTHYDVEFEEYIVENCPVEELQILVSEMHMHKEMKEGVVNKEVKALQKAGKTLKDTPVVNADKIDTPNYKGQKFGVKEADDWIQGAVKRPGAFTRKAKAAGMSVQQFAKNVDDNPGKYSTRTKKQANLAQTFASMKKEDVEELFYTLIVEGYQRDPEGGEAKERQRKREQKGGYDERRERRMNDPKRGINSPAFKEFMRQQGM